MIIIGIILLLVAYLLPDVVPDVPPGIIHIAYVLGWVALVIGVILFILSYFGRPVGPGIGRPVGGRRYWW